MQPLNRVLAAASDRHRYEGITDFGRLGGTVPTNLRQWREPRSASILSLMRPGADAVVSRSLENVAVWVDESVGELVR